MSQKNVSETEEECIILNVQTKIVFVKAEVQWTRKNGFGR